MRPRWLLAAILLCVGLAGCFDVQSGDLFVLTRTGQGQRLTLLLNDSGTVACNGGAAKTLPDPLLLEARDLATTLNNDAKAKLHIAAPANSVFFYTIKLQNGTITFPDTAGAQHPELAQAEQLALNVAQQGCGIGGT
jgi:hypothetical protein